MFVVDFADNQFRDSVAADVLYPVTDSVKSFFGGGFVNKFFYTYITIVNAASASGFRCSNQIDVIKLIFIGFRFRNPSLAWMLWCDFKLCFPI